MVVAHGDTVAQMVALARGISVEAVYQASPPPPHTHNPATEEPAEATSTSPRSSLTYAHTCRNTGCLNHVSLEWELSSGMCVPGEGTATSALRCRCACCNISIFDGM